MKHAEIFISYRVDDSSSEALRLYHNLIDCFGRHSVYLDKERDEVGDWTVDLKTAVTNARVMLALIRTRRIWLGVDEQGKKRRRIDDPEDWVSQELRQAYTQPGMLIIPVLLDKCPLPDALPSNLEFFGNQRYFSIEGATWKKDVQALVAYLVKKAHLLLLPPGTSDYDLQHDYPLPDDIDAFLEDEPDLSGDSVSPLRTSTPVFAPYLGLRHFGRKHAQLFFGRNQEIRTLLELVKRHRVRIIRVFGPSGVGKSSFLEAGVAPRLEAEWAPYMIRRNAVNGLDEQLAQKISEARKQRKPPVFILDQAEEMFTDPIQGELLRLRAQMAELLKTYARSTIVLSFRKEYVMDMDVFKYLDTYEDISLLPLGESALIEAVGGILRNEHLARAYSLELDAGFAQHVADDLLHTEGAGRASILQNRLLRLYEEAHRVRDKYNGKVYLAKDAYDALKREATVEMELLQYQLERLNAVVPGQQFDPKHVLKVLQRFVRDEPTAGSILSDDLEIAEQPALYAALKRVGLLTERRETERSDSPTKTILQLSHDLLARVVRQQHEANVKEENSKWRQEKFQDLWKKLNAALDQLNFDNALALLPQALQLNENRERLWPIAFRIAFVLLQADKKDRGLKAFDLAHDALTPGSNFTRPVLSRHWETAELLIQLRALDDSLYHDLEKEYFPTMIRLPDGEYDMGDILGDLEKEDELPHTIRLNTFELADTPVTWSQYYLFCLAHGYELPDDHGWGRLGHPAFNISWFEAVRYTEWLNIRMGLQQPIRHANNTYVVDLSANGFRLPTEAEWEYAARAGRMAWRFGNGRNESLPTDFNFDASQLFSGRYEPTILFREKTTPVRNFPANAFKLHDMSGNVWEWCWDWYAADYYQISQTDNPTGPETGKKRVLRGGSWHVFAEACRASNRESEEPGRQYSDVGFRLARSIQS